MERKRVINVDLSTKCTLECPKCPRYFFTKYNLKYTGHRMTDDEFEKISNYFQGILFCGQASDPMLHPKFSDFLKITKEKDIYTWVNTAVSHPPKSWYIKAFNANKQAVWNFGLDGLPDESHKYRINQDGNRLFEMMKLGVELGNDIQWQYIVFKYNQDHIEEAKKLADDNGIVFDILRSCRWDGPDDPYMPDRKEDYIDENFFTSMYKTQ